MTDIDNRELEDDSNEELFEHFKFQADPGQVVIRVDKFLIDRMPNTSRNKIQLAAKNGNIQVNGKNVKQNYKVKPGDEVALVLPYPIREIELIPQDIPLNIVYEDDHVVVVNKPSNMVVHPGYGNYKGTLVNALVYHFQNLPKKINDYYGRPGLVHRLDKNTTGLLVVAKTENSLNNLAKQFYNRTTERRYWALVWGDIEESGSVSGNVGRSLKNRKVMSVFPEGDHGKHAVTHYKVLERFGYVTLIECKLETGRTHQIRVHLAHEGHPVIGDPVYGGGSTRARTAAVGDNAAAMITQLGRQALHARLLGFVHPATGENLRFESEIPPKIREITGFLDETGNRADR